MYFLKQSTSNPDMWLKLDPLEPLPAGKHKETKGVWLKIERRKERKIRREIGRRKIERMLDRYTD